MKITNDVRDNIRSKYYDGIDERILTHLKRNFQVYLIKKNMTSITLRYIIINGKSYLVNNNKKYLKNRLSSFVKERFEDIQEKIRMKTIKMFLDMILGLEMN
jgi:macrodomain Ter protein organizer (MatP/YcbG family)